MLSEKLMVSRVGFSLACVLVTKDGLPRTGACGDCGETGYCCGNPKPRHQKRVRDSNALITQMSKVRCIINDER